MNGSVAPAEFRLTGSRLRGRPSPKRATPSRRVRYMPLVARSRRFTTQLPWSRQRRYPLESGASPMASSTLGWLRGCTRRSPGRCWARGWRRLWSRGRAWCSKTWAMCWSVVGTTALTTDRLTHFFWWTAPTTRSVLPRMRSSTPRWPSLTRWPTSDRRTPAPSGVIRCRLQWIPCISVRSIWPSRL